ncbi:hypothetical protein TrLO_g9391 [Triparma laevis f. longispina]|uniref:Uncharacterized protein n=1 Tax=Triparma laevis f. longispina TaxID=1714387 RepID=A0A9W7FSZ0_9STRA|nr:hypothetical protein TrLO_g9391 [Triparma laevis f. longispina]
MPKHKVGSTSTKPKSRAPKHQNTFAFKHNPNSKKTKQIESKPILGVCLKCKEKLEWRKKYRKYKPLTQPKNCVDCKKRTVLSAYHVVCVPCGKKRGNCCEICLGEKQEVKVEEGEGGVDLSGLRERERRAVMRRMERGEGGEEEEEEGKESCDEGEEQEQQEEEEEEEKNVVGENANVEEEETAERMEEVGEEEEKQEHFGAGNDLFGCGSSRNDARFKF